MLLVSLCSPQDCRNLCLLFLLLNPVGWLKVTLSTTLNEGGSKSCGNSQTRRFRVYLFLIFVTKSPRALIIEGVRTLRAD